jgi:hypothetical protein
MICHCLPPLLVGFYICFLLTRRVRVEREKGGRRKEEGGRR